MLCCRLKIKPSARKKVRPKQCSHLISVDKTASPTPARAQAPTTPIKFQGKSKLYEQQQRQAKADEKAKANTELDEELDAPPGLTRMDSPQIVSREVARVMEKKLVKQHSDSRRNELLKAIKDSEEQPDSKSHINLVVIGHVDAGKSTLMGHLLLLW